MKTLIFAAIVGVLAFYLWPFILVILSVVCPIVWAIISGIFGILLTLGTGVAYVVLAICMIIGFWTITKLIF